MKKSKECFKEVETTKEYDGYYYEVAEVISIVVFGSLCGLKNMKQVHQWASNERTWEFLRKEQGIKRIPCYYWFLCLLKLVKPESLNRCLKKWAERLLPAERKAVSVALGGKTIRSTGKMDSYESPLHIVQDDSLRKSWIQASKRRRTRAEWKRERHLLQLILHGFQTGRSGPDCTVLARFIQNLRKRAEKPANGIITSPAGN